MSFLFNFAADETENVDREKHEVESHQKKETSLEKSDVKAAPAKEISKFYDSITSKFETTTMGCGDHILKVVDTSKVEKHILEDESFKIFTESRNLACALSSNSDLVAGVYEGGLKVWECGMDMVDFLSSHSVGKAIGIKGKRILELGCGAGLPGVFCCSCGAQAVDFQDYNEEVLQLVTRTNVVNNTCKGTTAQSRYFSGDWSSLSHLLQKEHLKYDVILSAETIYNPDNYASLHSVFDTALSDDGVIIVSAKVYYFGVGGSIEAFTEYLDTQRCFTMEAVHDINAGVPRKILILRRLAKVSR